MNTPFFVEEKISPPGIIRQTSLIWISLAITFLLIMGWILTRVGTPISPTQQTNTGPVWGTKPVLGYFLLTASLSDTLRTELNLTDGQYQKIRNIAQDEVARINELESESAIVLKDKELTLAEKRAWIEEIGYNQRLLKVLDASQQSLKGVIPPITYRRLVNWIENRWQLERKLHGSLLKASSARTFRVFATRFDSGGSYIVALPDKCVKFANAGNSVCADDGYEVNQNYSVSLHYKGGTTAKVLESGPWNIDDAYWATAGDPTPRRMFADLPLGMPEAQAAYFNNYNGGLDQFGRKVSAPYGIDLGRQVSIDIGLEPGNNDWIDVTFLWTKGWESGSDDDSVSSGSVPEVIIPVEIATPLADGSIIHEVQQGQALLHIANAYEIELAQLFEFNNLSFDSIIQPGDRLIVQPAKVTLTPTPNEDLERLVTIEATPVSAKPSPTPIKRTSTPQAASNATIETSQPSAMDEGSAQGSVLFIQQLGIDTILIVIVVLFLLGLILVLFGRVLKGDS